MSHWQLQSTNNRSSPVFVSFLSFSPFPVPGKADRSDELRYLDDVRGGRVGMERQEAAEDSTSKNHDVITNAVELSKSVRSCILL
jgi:hypothetical protein